MQIRQLEALQAMARTSGSKVVFVPMNLGAMGAASVDQVTQQLTASAHDGEHHEFLGAPSSSTQAGLLTSMANV